MNLKSDSRVVTNWSAIAAIVMTAITITTFYSSLRSEIDEQKK